MVKICVVGCLHGELDKVYTDIAAIENEKNFSTDLVICCGDFQSVRNPSDLHSMSVPEKYRLLGDFWRYYAGKRTAPITTIFVGGNHEASNYLQELPYGGWVAPNIYYMGYANVLNFRGIRIAGLSGIYKRHDFGKGRFERPPFTEDTKRSAYHTRNIDVFRLMQVKQNVDIVVSHDWPRGIYHYGDVATLLRQKPHFAEEVQCNSLGSEESERLLTHLKPRYWFAAHMHVKFPARVLHPVDNLQEAAAATSGEQEEGSSSIGITSSGRFETKFLALTKCRANWDYLQFLDIEPWQPVCEEDDNEEEVAEENKNTSPVSTTVDDVRVQQPTDNSLALDPEWLCILSATNHLMSLDKCWNIMPSRASNEKSEFSPSDKDIEEMQELFDHSLQIPNNFVVTAPVCDSEEGQMDTTQRRRVEPQPTIFVNPQTTLLCEMLELKHPNLIWKAKTTGEDVITMAASVAAAAPAGFYLDTNSELLNLDDSEEEQCSDEDSHEEEDGPLPKYQPSCIIDGDNATKYVAPLRTKMCLPSPKNPEVDVSVGKEAEGAIPVEGLEYIP